MSDEPEITEPEDTLTPLLVQRIEHAMADLYRPLKLDVDWPRLTGHRQRDVP